MKNIKKNNLNVSKDFSAREAGVLLESMDKSIKLVAEQHGNIVEKLETLAKGQDVLAKNHLVVIKKLEEHDERFDGIDKRFDGIDKKLETEYVKREEFLGLAQ